MKKFLLIIILAVLSPATFAKPAARLKNPAKGVLCDPYFCADRNGVSTALTRKYLSKKRAKALNSQGTFDKSAFTFSNGVFCDTKEHKCHADRYFSDCNRGSSRCKRSPAAEKETRLLFVGMGSE